MTLGVDSTTNRNEYQEAARKADNFAICEPLV
jgi:hypothetical protein